MDYKVHADAYKMLGCAIVIQMLKDYFHKPTKQEILDGYVQFCNPQVIKKQLQSDYLYSLTDGLSLTVLRKLNEDEEAVRENVKRLGDD